MLPPFLNRLLFPFHPPLPLSFSPSLLPHSLAHCCLSHAVRKVCGINIFISYSVFASASLVFSHSCYSFSLSSRLYSCFNLFPSLSSVSQPPFPFTFHFSDASVSCSLYPPLLHIMIPPSSLLSAFPSPCTSYLHNMGYTCKSFTILHRLSHGQYPHLSFLSVIHTFCDLTVNYLSRWLSFFPFSPPLYLLL